MVKAVKFAMSNDEPMSASRSLCVGAGHAERVSSSPPCQGGVRGGAFVEAEEPPPTPPWQGPED